MKPKFALSDFSFANDSLTSLLNPQQPSGVIEAFDAHFPTGVGPCGWAVLTKRGCTKGKCTKCVSVQPAVDAQIVNKIKAAATADIAKLLK